MAAQQERKENRRERPVTGHSRMKPGKRPRSLRFWLFMSTILCAAIPLLIVGGVFFIQAEDIEVETTCNRIMVQTSSVADRLSADGFMENPDDIISISILNQEADIWGGRITIADASFKIIYDSYMTDRGKYQLSENVINCMNGTGTGIKEIAGDYIDFAQPINTTAQDGTVSVSGVMLVTVDKKPLLSAASRFSQRQLLLIAIAVIIVAPTIFILVWFLLKPIKKLNDTVVHVLDDYDTARLDIRTYAETEDIIKALQTTCGKIQQLNDSRQGFVSDVSHELKTPITSIRVLADSIISMEDAPIELYKEFMADISREVDREAKIIDDLLELSKLDRKANVLNIEKVDIKELVEITVKRLRPIAKLRGIDLLFESFKPVMAEVDEMKFNLAITNICENAIKYNKDNGWVRISLNSDAKFFFIKVADSGVGIPQDEMENIFERFYRVDKARSRETGGTGLGLSITKSIINLHGGAIRVYSKTGEGTTFVIRTPLLHTKKQKPAG